MPFRVSDSTIFANSLRNIRLNRYELSRVQNQLTSGKRINSLADDPTAAMQILRLRRGLDRIEQFERNIGAARAQLEPTESALSSLTDTLIRLRELTVSADIEVAEFDLIRQEVEQLFNSVVALANTRVNGQYLFGGFAVDTPPFTVAGSFSDASASPPPAVTYAGDNGRFQIQIGEASTVDANASGQFIFLGDTDNDNAPNAPNVDIFATVLDLRNRLRDGTITDPASTVLDDLDAALSQVLQTRSMLGATLNRLDITESQLRSLEVTLEIERSSIEDLDIIEASTRLQSRENTFQASLAVTARVIQPSLLNFLS